jgi:hypothetical protein
LTSRALCAARGKSFSRCAAPEFAVRISAPTRGVNPLVSYPRIIGHEIAGEVLEVPEDEIELMPGDRVILEPYVYCGHCYPCSIGRTNCCENLTVRGVYIDGGMAEYVSHPRHLLHKVPGTIPWNLVPLAEPLVIAMHAVKQSETKSGALFESHLPVLIGQALAMLVRWLTTRLAARNVCREELQYLNRSDPAGEKIEAAASAAIKIDFFQPCF